MYKPCGADSLIYILKDLEKHYVCSGDSQCEMRLAGIVSHKTQGKGNISLRQQAHNSFSPQKPHLLFSEFGPSIPAEADVWGVLTKNVNSEFQKRQAAALGQRTRGSTSDRVDSLGIFHLISYFREYAQLSS